MNNPLSHVGQTAHPEQPTQGQQQAEQAQSPQQGGQDARQPGADTSELPPATRLPQHPSQQGDEPVQDAGQPRVPQPGESKAEDSKLPSPTEAD